MSEFVRVEFWKFQKNGKFRKKVIKLFIRNVRYSFVKSASQSSKLFKKARENTFETNENWKPSKNSSKQTDCSFDNTQTFNENMYGKFLLTVWKPSKKIQENNQPESVPSDTYNAVLKFWQLCLIFSAKIPLILSSKSAKNWTMRIFSTSIFFFHTKVP